MNRYSSDSIDLSSVYFWMESYGDNAFLAAVGWVYRPLSLSTNHTARGIKSILVPTSNDMGDNDAIASPESVLGSRYPFDP